MHRLPHGLLGPRMAARRPAALPQPGGGFCRAPVIVALAFLLDSPSIMDISITSEAEERPNVNNVPDYVSDIHTYLREMEVRCHLFSCLHIWADCI